MSVRRYNLVTDADAARIEPGATIELAAGGRVTPLAAETLANRGVTVRREARTDQDVSPGLAPPFPVARVAIGSDHVGIGLKAALVDYLRSGGRAVTDCGTHGTASVDYPDIAAAVADLVAAGEADAGIVVDGAGLGSAIAANKVPGIRAAMCTDTTLARYAREHNGANVLALGATLVNAEAAREIVDVWLSTPTREPRYLRRLAKIHRLEDRR